MNDRNIIEIECNINENIKKLKLEISSDINDEQIIKICYQIKPGNNIKELRNVSYSKIKNEMILLYNGFINDFNYEINYNDHKIHSLCDKEIINKVVYFDPLIQKKEIVNINQFNFEEKNQRIKIMLYGIIEELIDWYPLIRDFRGKFIEWYSYYKGGKFESVIQYIIGNYRNEYNNFEKKFFSFNNIIYFIKVTKSEKISDCFGLLFDYFYKNEKDILNNQINNIIKNEKEMGNQKSQDELDKQKIIFIFKLYEIFSSKYELIKKNDFKINAKNIMNEDLKEYSQKCFYNYFIMDEDNIKKYIENHNIIIKENFHKNEKDIIYLISKDEEPKIRSDKNKNFNIIKNGSNIQEDNEENIIKYIDDYKLIQIPDEYQQNDFIIVNNFYQKLIDETILLPRILKEAVDKTNQKLLEKCNYNFNIMYYLFTVHQEQNNSILSTKINQFKDKFINLCHILQNAGVDFTENEIIYQKLQKIQYQNANFIEFKNKEIDKKIEDIWYIKNSNDEENNDINNEEQNIKNETEENFIDKDIESSEEEFKLSDDEENDEKENEVKEENSKIIEEKKEIKTENIEIKEIKTDKFGTKIENKLNNDEDSNNDEDENNFNILRDQGYAINQDSEISKEKILKIEQKIFDNYDVNEIDGINRCIIKSKLLTYYSSISIKKFEGYIIPKDSFNYKYHLILIEQLYNESIYLSQYLMYRIINSLKNNNINFDRKCVTILLDCSVYIMPDKKIANMVILCAITMVLNCLNIKYSIGLFGEEEFKIIMKQFDEEHSLLTLQKVYECLMMKRYRTNLASVVYFAKQNIKFVGENNNKYNFYKKHPEQIIYIITDGLDEELKCIYRWKYIIRDESVKLGFIFNQPNKIEEIIKNEKKYGNDKKNRNKDSISDHDIMSEDNISNIYDDNFSILSDISNYSAAFPINNNNYDEDNINENDIKIIIQKWKNFIEQNSSSYVRTTLLNSKEGKLDDKSMKIFSYGFTYLICNSIDKNKVNEDKIIYEYKVNEPIYLINFDFIKNIKYNYKNNEKPYVNNIELKAQKTNRVEEISYSKYSCINEIKGKILKSTTKYNYLKKQLDDFIYNEFLSDSPGDIYTRRILEYIFPPNKASQKVLSTTGSEIDINAFFLHYLSKDPEPLFYLEEKGGYIRKYSISIIIDISKSVMNEFNKGHSFSIIKTFLKFLRFVDIPYLDIIIAKGGNPIFLCCGLSSRKVLSKESEFWIGLIHCLCNPKVKTFLSPCIDIAYYLNMERTDYSNYLFVLTDGLFDLKENNNIIENVLKCIQNNIKVFGIGLGFYPYNINSLFPKIIYTKSPEKLFNAISYFFDKNIDVNNEKLIPLLRDVSLNFPNIIKNLMNNKDNTITDIKEILQNKFVINYLLYDNFNEPTDINEMKNTFDALNDPRIQLLKKNSLKGQKILIVMLWTYKLNPNEENPKIMPGNLFESGIPNQSVGFYHPSINKYCVETAMKDLGAEIYVVTNYKDANYELLKTINGKCPYYCVWIISGFDKLNCQIKMQIQIY